MKKIVLLDLDNTMFDSAGYRKSLWQRISDYLAQDQDKLSVVERCQGIYDQLLVETGAFDAEEFAGRLAGDNMRQKQKILQLIFDDHLFRKHYHSDTAEALRLFSKFADVAVFSQGNKKFQSAKLPFIRHYFSDEQIHITMNKKKQIKHVFEKYKTYKIYYIDDILPILFEAYKIDPSVQTIWIRRGRYALIQEPIEGFNPSLIVDTLLDAVAFVREN